MLLVVAVECLVSNRLAYKYLYDAGAISVGKERKGVRQSRKTKNTNMREIVHIQAGQCGNQIGAKVRILLFLFL